MTKRLAIRRAPLRQLWPLLLLMALGLPLPSAHARRLDFAVEARTAGLFTAGSAGQLGDGTSSGVCGPQPTADGGTNLSATVLALLQDKGSRYQLAGSVGYYALGCTPQLRRPVGGFDYKGEHQLTSNLRLTSSARAVFDVFDRSLDIRTGTLDPGAAEPGTAATDPALGQAAGVGFMLGSASVELTRSFAMAYALRAGLSLRLMQVSDVLQLPESSTLGPMEVLEIPLAFGREIKSDRFEGLLRYRLSHLYAATFRDVLTRSQVPSAHDVYVAGVWERKLLPNWTLHVEAGPALAFQPQLCQLFDQRLQANDQCSYDDRAPGIRGYDAPPPLEATLGRRTTLTLAGEASLAYAIPRRRFELHLSRSYDADPYAGALSLIDRLAGELSWRPSWDLALYGNLQLLHTTQTSPARTSALPEGEPTQPLAPQNRTLWMALGSFGADYRVWQQLSVFAETSFQLMKIRGERVPETSPQGMYAQEVASFPSPVLPPGGTPPAAADPQSYQTTERLTILLGLRVQLSTLPRPRREIDLLQSARAVP